MRADTPSPTDCVGGTGAPIVAGGGFASASDGTVSSGGSSTPDENGLDHTTTVSVKAQGALEETLGGAALIGSGIGVGAVCIAATSETIVGPIACGVHAIGATAAGAFLFYEGIKSWMDLLFGRKSH